MLAALVRHASGVEIFWVVGTLVGVVANAWGLLDALADQRWLRGSGLNGRRKTVARWHVELNAALTWVQVVFLAAGVRACLTPNTTTGSTHTTAVLVQLLFISAEPALVYVAVEAHRYRARLLATRSTGAVAPDATDLEARS